MYIPTWFIIVAVIVGWYFYSKSRRKTSTSDDKPTTFDEMWEQAERNKERVFSKSPNLENHLQNERDMVTAMERDAIRLRERYKHDPKKQLEIAQDWMDYSDAVAETKFAREMLDVDIEDNAFDRFDERTKVPFLTVQEIGKRVEEELGEDSSSRIVHNRMKEHSKVTDEILGKSAQKLGIKSEK